MPRSAPLPFSTSLPSLDGRGTSFISAISQEKSVVKGCKADATVGPQWAAHVPSLWSPVGKPGEAAYSRMCSEGGWDGAQHSDMAGLVQ